MPVVSSTSIESSRLPRRDYYVIPLLIAGTIAVMFAFAEIGARMLWPKYGDEGCAVKGELDPRRAMANCTELDKIPESAPITYHFNECAYRSNASCGPKPPDTLRIVMLGASMTEGLEVAYDETFGERTRKALERATGKKIELQNLGYKLLTPLHVYRQMNQVMALHPDMVLYAVNPYDLSRGIDPKQLAHRNDPPPPPSAHISTHPPKDHLRLQDILKQIQLTLNENSRAFVMAQHFLFSNTETFLRIYLADGDRADYLRQPYTPSWKTQFSDLDVIVTDMASRLHKQGIPMMLMALPARSQVALLAVGHQPPHTDAYAFEQEIQKISQHAGTIYIPTLQAFMHTPNPDSLFYVVDTHITGEGNAVIARELIHKCLEGGVPAFSARPLQSAKN